MSRYHIVHTAFGYAALAFEIDPFRLLEVKLPYIDLDLLCQPYDDRHWQIDNTHAKALVIADTLVRYFKAERIRIPWSVMDLSPYTSAQQTVYRTVAKIPYGQTASYGDVSRMAGLPRAARFVGTTMANNRYPVFIPCHRVIKSDGSAGGFGGGSALKERMLALETVS